MEAGFWKSRWRDGQIGFHEGRPNELLRSHLARLGTGRTVFVPLCGKSEDLAFLAAQGHRVVGVEWVEDAVKAFFSERSLTPTVTRVQGIPRYEVPGVTLFAGDVFAMTAEVVGPIDALYDRAALIALPPDVRTRYVKHLRSILPSGAPGLVITVEYDVSKLEGPPFSIPDAELKAHYAGVTELTLLEDRKAEGPRFTAANAREKCFGVRL